MYDVDEIDIKIGLLILGQPKTKKDQIAVISVSCLKFNNCLFKTKRQMVTMYFNRKDFLKHLSTKKNMFQ